MANNTVVGVFDSYAEAERAVNDLMSAGFTRERLQLTASETATTATTAGTATTARSSHDDDSFGERISRFFSSLFGGDEDREDAGYYSEAVRQGSAVVTVNAASDDEAERAADILNERGAVDIRERAQQWRQAGQSGTAAEGLSGTPRGAFDARDDEKVIPVVDEELQVGKRRRDRGGVRIYAHMEETPVEEKVRLREEHVNVERRPADRPASDADLAAFKEGSIEVRETVEEPVVAKRTRVVEEVVIDKETSERTETVNDTVRKGEVDVEQLGAGSRASGTMNTYEGKTYDEYDADYRAHWQSSYGTAGGAYEQYLPAYRYGSALAEDERYRGRQWNEVEADARRDWEARYPGGAWDKFKAAVRHGWQKMTGR